MDEQSRTELECKIQSLLCNELGESERNALLRRMQPRKGRRELMNMLTCREQARAAYGYDGVEPAIRDSLAALAKSLHDGTGTGT